MNKKILALIICLFCLFSLVACKKIYVQDGEHNLVMDSNSLVESNSLTELLIRAKNVSNIFYEQTSIDAKGKAVAQKFWLKGAKMRIESGDNVTIVDQHDNLVYLYIPTQHKATKQNFNLGQPKEASIVDQANNLSQYQAEVSGNEVIDGKNCLVIQYKWGSATAKAWLWQKYGLPVKIETNDGKTKTAISYGNFDFSAIPDNMFELPNDVKMADMTILPDLKNLNLPKIK